VTGVESTTADVAPAADLVRVGIRAATAYGRPDLAARLAAAGRRLTGRTTVLVVGEYKQGKSSLVDSVLGVEVCPVDDDLATRVPTVVEWAATLTVTAFPADDGPGRPLSLDRLRAAVTEEAPEALPDTARVVVGLPSPLLADGLTFVDTPGAGGLSGPFGALTAAALPLADAVLFVSDAGQELTAAELAFLSAVRALCPRTMLVKSRIDLVPAWTEIVALDRGHLRAAGLDVPVAATSARLRALAMERLDDGLDDESGVPAVLDWLLDDVAAGCRRATAADVGAEVVEVARLLRVPFEDARTALDGDDDAALATAADRVQSARRTAGRWAQTLADGVADLVSDVEHDLRERLRGVTTDAEAAIDGMDPATAWGEYERRLYQQTAAAVMAHYAFRDQRLRAVVATVSAVLGDGQDGTVAGLSSGSGEAQLPAAELTLDVSRARLTSQGLTLLRSSYGGLAMLGFLGAFAGIAVAAPVMAAAGLLFGGKGLKDERARQLAARRSAAKVSVRRYLDEVSFALGKETRDTLRHTQRTLREHFSARAEEVQRSAAEALRAAKEAAAADAAARAARLADVESELRRLAALEERARRLAGEPQPVPA
jgi:hypothetical protein